MCAWGQVGGWRRGGGGGGGGLGGGGIERDVNIVNRYCNHREVIYSPRLIQLGEEGYSRISPLSIMSMQYICIWYKLAHTPTITSVYLCLHLN